MSIYVALFYKAQNLCCTPFIPLHLSPFPLDRLVSHLYA